jgi:hypothetical protein
MDKPHVHQPIIALVPTYMLIPIYQLMYLEVLLTDNQMDNKLETHLEEVHPKEIHLEDHHFIHMLDHMDGQHLNHACLYHHGINNCCVTCTKTNNETTIQKLQYPTYVKDTNHDAHIKVFKKAIKANGETMEANFNNLFGFTPKDSIFKWGEIFVQNHPNCTFEELEQAFCK